MTQDLLPISQLFLYHKEATQAKSVGPASYSTMPILTEHLLESLAK